MGKFNRRDVLAAGTAAWIFVGPTHAQPQRMRPRVFGAERPAALESYKRAVQAMLALPPSDPRNWHRQALIHILDCPHQNWWFLPWHRGYLRQFERICGELIGEPNFALPYWDWTQSPSMPIAFFDPEFDTTTSRYPQTWEEYWELMRPAVTALMSNVTPDQAQQLSRRGLSAQNIEGVLRTHYRRGIRRVTLQRPQLHPAAAAVVREGVIRSNVDSQLEYEAFASGPAAHHHQMVSSGALETGAHDNVHGSVGGWMGAWLSPTDPIFWLHHGNLDRLWAVWERGRKAIGESELPDDTAALYSAQFRWFVAPNGTMQSVSARDCMTADYGYAPGAGEPVPQPSRSVARSEVFASLDALRSTFRINRESSLRIEVPEEILQSAVAPAPRLLQARITLNAPQDPSAVRFRVYVNCPYLSQFTPVEDDHYVGTISPFFGGATSRHGEHHEHSEGLTYTVPLNPALEALGAEGDLPRSALRVQLIVEDRDGDDAAGRMLDGALTGIEIVAH